jgi:hypothetical protein
MVVLLRVDGCEGCEVKNHSRPRFFFRTAADIAAGVWISGRVQRFGYFSSDAQCTAIDTFNVSHFFYLFGERMDHYRKNTTEDIPLLKTPANNKTHHVFERAAINGRQTRPTTRC